MYCPKCGIEIPDNSAFCRSCGARVESEATKGEGPGGEPASPLYSSGFPVEALIVVASLLTILGTFLPWTGDADFCLLGINMVGANGAVVCLLAVLLLGALVLSRGGATGAWHVVMALLSLAAMALTFQYLFWLNDNEAPILYGFWVTVAGVVGIAIGTTLLFFKTIRVSF